MIGSHIGRFRITAPLGRGGIATVWRAHDELLGREVALKILSEDLSESTKARRRFVHEAIATAKLSHPGIVSIYEHGEHEGRAYIAYALIDGDTVSELASRRRMPVAEVVRIAVAAADALAHAHSFGVIHRDITGRNIMVARDGRVIVLDFGLALAAGMTRLTTSERAVGTVAYMSPEATLGQDCDARSDLYGLGIVMYEMLTGRFPFPGDRPESMIYAKLNLTPEPPSAHRPEVPGALDQIVMKAIHRDAAERYASAGEMLAALRVVGRNPTAEPSPPGPAAPPPAPRIVDSNQVTRPHPLYLAVLPFEIAGDAASESLHAHMTRFGEPLNAMLSKSNVRPVTVTATSSGDLRAMARELGANALLRGCARISGSRVRATWGIVDPESGVQWVGDVVEGSALMPFELEDRLIASVARGLGLPPPPLVDRVESRPRDPAAADRMALALRYLERYDNEASVDGAIAILEQRIASEGEDAATAAALARAYGYKHRFTRQAVWSNRAATACDRAVHLEPNAPDVLTALAEVHFESGQIREAIDEYQRALKARPRMIEGWVGLSRARQAAGDIPGAREACRRAIEIRPQDWRGHFREARVLYDSGHYQDSIPPLRQAVSLAPDNALAWRTLAAAYFHLDRFEEAAGAYRESLGIQPSAGGFSSLATVMYHLGEYEESIRAFERATALAPADPQAWGNLGSACRWIEGHEEQAEMALERAIGLMRERLERDPADAQAWQWCAGWLSNRGRHDQALDAIQRALTLAPHDVEVLAQAGPVYLLAGDRAKALQMIRDAVRRGYGTGVLQRSPALAPLRSDPEFLQILQESPAPQGSDSNSATDRGTTV